MLKTQDKGKVHSKCMKCQYRDKKNNFCTKLDKDCSLPDVDFAKCNDYLVNDKLCMFNERRILSFDLAKD